MNQAAESGLPLGPYTGETRARVAEVVTNWAGWLILMAALQKSLILFIPFVLAIISGKLAAVTAALMLPVWLLNVAGAVGLIRRRFWGFWIVYGAAALSLFSGAIAFASGSLLFPFVERWLQFGPLTLFIHQGINLLILTLLAWCHGELRRAMGRPPWPPTRKYALVLAASACLAAGAWWNRVDYQSGEVDSLRDIRTVGGAFADLAVEGPVHIEGIHLVSARGMFLVCSGRVSEQSLTNFAAQAGLATVPMPAEPKKRAPWARNWKLPEDRFTQEFGEDGRVWVGRLPGHRKLALLVWWRPADGRFTCELLGRMSPTQ